MDGSISRWFDREIAGCSLADRRLTKRLRSLLERMGDAMGASIPLACQDWANTKCAFRSIVITDSVRTCYHAAIVH